MSLGTSSECWASTRSFFGLQSEYFSSEKSFCVPDFRKFPRRAAMSALFRCWRTVTCWHFFGFKGESLRSIFYSCPHWFSFILKSRAFFSWSVWSPSLPSLEQLWCCFSDDMNKIVRFWDNLSCCSSPHHKLWVLILLTALLSLIKPRAIKSISEYLVNNSEYF